MGTARRRIIVLLLLAAFAGAGYLLFFKAESGTQRGEIRVGPSWLTAEIARTAEERTRGLSGRPRLGENEAMLFIFDEPDFHGIWMKEMRFPVDIIWIGEDMRIGDMRKNITPDSYPEVFYPRSPAKYVLETNAGWADRHGIKANDVVSW